MADACGGTWRKNCIVRTASPLHPHGSYTQSFARKHARAYNLGSRISRNLNMIERITPAPPNQVRSELFQARTCRDSFECVQVYLVTVNCKRSSNHWIAIGKCSLQVQSFDSRWTNNVSTVCAIRNLPNWVAALLSGLVVIYPLFYRSFFIFIRLRAFFLMHFFMFQI